MIRIQFEHHYQRNSRISQSKSFRKIDQLLPIEESIIQPKRPTKKAAVFETLRDFKRETQQLESKQLDPKLQKLTDLFKPPIEILCHER